MVALQLLSHLEGDALNVALLVPEVRRATRAELVKFGALTEHYGSPARPVGRLSKPIREDDSSGPVDIRNRAGNTCG